MMPLLEKEISRSSPRVEEYRQVLRYEDSPRPWTSITKTGASLTSVQFGTTYYLPRSMLCDFPAVNSVMSFHLLPVSIQWNRSARMPIEPD